MNWILNVTIMAKSSSNSILGYEREREREKGNKPARPRISIGNVWKKNYVLWIRILLVEFGSIQISSIILGRSGYRSYIKVLVVVRMWHFYLCCCWWWRTQNSNIMCWRGGKMVFQKFGGPFNNWMKTKRKTDKTKNCEQFVRVMLSVL